MKQNQRVYIKGNIKRGKEVIKFLEKLGGRNAYHFDGHNIDAYYFINPKGVITNCPSIDDGGIFPYVKEFYKETQLPRWKPKYEDHFYLINTTGEVIEIIWFNTQFDKLCLEFGNCFRTKEEAEAAKDKIKNLLNNE